MSSVSSASSNPLAGIWNTVMGFAKPVLDWGSNFVNQLGGIAGIVAGFTSKLGQDAAFLINGVLGALGGKYLTGSQQSMFTGNPLAQSISNLLGKNLPSFLGIK
jgi:hypothetical protein